VAQWKGEVYSDGAPSVNVDYKVLCEATNNFNDDHLLGSGASCKVFKATIYGYPAAIKVINSTASTWNTTQFEAEIGMLCRTRHIHINKLLAVAVNGESQCLLLEYIEVGALERRPPREHDARAA
jgi:hypothetical protein